MQFQRRLPTIGKTVGSVYGTLITEKGYQTLSLLLQHALGGLPSGDTVSFCEKAVHS